MNDDLFFHDLGDQSIIAYKDGLLVLFQLIHLGLQLFKPLLLPC